MLQYPAAGSSDFNINSFLGPLDTHGGKLFVPQASYARFLREYTAAFHDGYRLYLTEYYGTQPFRYFLELDFAWELSLRTVRQATGDVLRVIREQIMAEYGLQRLPYTLVSMRTPYKVHINCPHLVTTELQAMRCRERIIAACRHVCAWMVVVVCVYEWGGEGCGDSRCRFRRSLQNSNALLVSCSL
jgi:hypothetical protein